MIDCLGTLLPGGGGGGGNEFLFILAASNLTLGQSIFMKQIILALDPENYFGSTGLPGQFFL